MHKLVKKVGEYVNHMTYNTSLAQAVYDWARYLSEPTLYMEFHLVKPIKPWGMRLQWPGVGMVTTVNRSRNAATLIGQIQGGDLLQYVRHGSSSLAVAIGFASSDAPSLSVIVLGHACAQVSERTWRQTQEVVVFKAADLKANLIYGRDGDSLTACPEPL